MLRRAYIQSYEHGEDLPPYIPQPHTCLNDEDLAATIATIMRTIWMAKCYLAT